MLQPPGCLFVQFAAYQEVGMSECECGCGKLTKGGDFIPGHDRILRTDLEKRVGGLLALRSLVDSSESYAEGKINLKDFGDMIKNTFSAINR